MNNSINIPLVSFLHLLYEFICVLFKFFGGFGVVFNYDLFLKFHLLLGLLEPQLEIRLMVLSHWLECFNRFQLLYIVEVGKVNFTGCWRDQF